MNSHEYNFLQAEKSALEEMIAQLPESSIIDRMSLEARKREVEKALSEQPNPPRSPIRAKLTFRGKPIVGNQGIFAKFGSVALGAFSDAIAATGASLNAQLGTRGALPNRDEYDLLVVGPALGSFGFELEEPPKEMMLLPPEKSKVEEALEQVKAIMKASTGSDEELTEAIFDTDQRALETIRSFLLSLASYDAVCALEFKDEVFRFSDVEQVRRSEKRLSQDNIHEKDEQFTGQFLGYLPSRRTFDFQIEESEDVITGKVGKEIEDAEQINQLLYKSMEITVHKKQVGTVKPRYTLKKF